MCNLFGMEKLHLYLESQGLSQRDFAAKLGWDRTILSRIMTGALVPTLERAAAIESATNGAVPMQAWMPNAPANDAPESGEAA